MTDSPNLLEGSLGSGQALCVAVNTKIGAEEVIEALFPLFLKHGKPEHIRSDNGPEFIAEKLQAWLLKADIKPLHIYPGSPWENGYNNASMEPYVMRS
ncbi:DDE-type integrase/transposase/recombinase [Lentilitoribacter sp. EG35]|uniref:DDE-type integrase/transposase/recombinase n=1 Tax=Lentilitoribacter sp. EG35 TaxID=3234192 RepID=UPI00345FD76D